jgi:adenylate cyclase
MEPGVEDKQGSTGRPGWSQPLRLHLSVVIVILLLGISLPLMWLTYQQGTRSATQAAEQQMLLLSRHAIDRYRNIFGGGYSVVSLTAASRVFVSEPPAELDAKTDFLLKALAGSQTIDGIYVGYPSGAFVHAVSIAADPAWREAIGAPQEASFAVRTIENAEFSRTSTWRFYNDDGRRIGEGSGDASYDPRERPWYRTAALNPDPISVGPYVMATTRKLGVTLARAMQGHGEIVVGADVLLEMTSRLLSAEAVSKNAKGYVFDDAGRLIVHSDEEIMKRVLAALNAADASAQTISGDPALGPIRVLVSRASTGSEQTARFDVDGEPYLAEIATTDANGLLRTSTVGIAAPLADFTAASVALLKKALAVAVALLAVGILLSVIVAGIVSRSLSSLTLSARQIGNLQLDTESKVHSRVAEINTLDAALGAARRAIGTFALYMPRELVRKIVASGQSAAGSAVRQEVTVLFTDIRDFTTISESRTPEEVVALLTAYFEQLNQIVERHNGVIVQYLGDSIYAMWNAPEPDPDHVDDACRCVLALKEGVAALNDENRAAGLPELITRFGVHTGEAVVGSVGARSRRQYTAMGDTVNVASRLEGMNKEFGTTILVSAALRRRADPAFGFRPLGTARAKGRIEGIEVFELTGDVQSAPPSGVLMQQQH